MIGGDGDVNSKKLGVITSFVLNFEAKAHKIKANKPRKDETDAD
jgi:hypothetical protein